MRRCLCVCCAIFAISLVVRARGAECAQTAAAPNLVTANATTVSGLPAEHAVAGRGTPAAATGLEEGRGKKKKMKNTSMNMMLGGSMMTAFVVIFMFLNMITVTIGKAFLFTFIAKFLVSVNWKQSGHQHSSKKSSHKDITVLMGRQNE